MDDAKGPYTTQHNPPYRTAIVYAIEASPPYRVKVQFPDRGNIISYWLPVVVPGIQGDKFFWQPAIGEQVKVTMDENDENGTVDGCVPSNVDAAPEGLGPGIYYIGFADGTTFQYNGQTHQMSIALGAGASLAITQPSGGGITLDAMGNIEIASMASISFSGGGGATTGALALVSKLVAAFNAHTHPADNTPPTTPWTAATVDSTLIKVSG